MDSLVDLNATSVENFGFVISSFPSFPPTEIAANQPSFNGAESVGESYNLFQLDPINTLSLNSISPSISPPTFDPSPNPPAHDLISVSAPTSAYLSPDPQLPAVRERRQIDPLSLLHKCPHCRRHFESIHQVE